jgi:CheY-like chemotaxis protein
MATTLKQLGYDTRCERDGESGLRAAKEATPSAVVLDLVMPGMNGFEFLDRLRADPAGKRVPVIVWTVKDLSSAEHALLRASATAVVAKGHGGSAAVIAQLQGFLPEARGG